MRKVYKDSGYLAEFYLRLCTKSCENHSFVYSTFLSLTASVERKKHGQHFYGKLRGDYVIGFRCLICFKVQHSAHRAQHKGKLTTNPGYQLIYNWQISYGAHFFICFSLPTSASHSATHSSCFGWTGIDTYKVLEVQYLV